MSAIDKYNQRAKKIYSLLCVGLDTDFAKISKKFKEAGNPQFEFNKWIIDQTHEYASAFKLNSAFYEARGLEGIKDLKQTIEYIQKKHPDIFTILDAKRGDIGNTNKGYATFAFDWLGVDAITLNPYVGRQALLPFLERKDKVSIILCRTSNIGASELQNFIVDDAPLWENIAQKVVREWNGNKNCMLVMGAIHPEEIKRVRSFAGDMTFLVPGIGAQGGSVKDVMRAGKNTKGLGLIIHSSRGIIFSESPKNSARKLRDEIRNQNNWQR